MYQIEYTASAVKELRHVPKAQVRLIVQRIAALQVEPRPDSAITLRGYPGLYRIRQGKYRIIYRIHDDVLTVLIVKVGHRGEVYRKL